MNWSHKNKIIFAIVTVVLSFIIGTYTKVAFVLYFNDPFLRWLNVFLYIFSWVMLFIAAFMVGKEALILGDQWMRKKMKDTYDTTVDLHKKGLEKSIHTTKHIHKKSVETTKELHKKAMEHGKRHHKAAKELLKKYTK